MIRCSNLVLSWLNRSPSFLGRSKHPTAMGSFFLLNQVQLSRDLLNEDEDVAADCSTGLCSKAEECRPETRRNPGPFSISMTTMSFAGGGVRGWLF